MKATIKLEDGRTLDVELNEEQLNYPTKADPMTWEKLERVEGWFIDDDSKLIGRVYADSFKKNKNIYPTKEHAEAALAEAQLLQLRNWYRGDWKPKERENVYSVVFDGVTTIISSGLYASNPHQFFCFPRRDVAARFMEEQRELLEVWAKKFSA